MSGNVHNGSTFAIIGLNGHRGPIKCALDRHILLSRRCSFSTSTSPAPVQLANQNIRPPKPPIILLKNVEYIQSVNINTAYVGIKWKLSRHEVIT